MNDVIRKIGMILVRFANRKWSSNFEKNHEAAKNLIRFMDTHLSVANMGNEELIHAAIRHGFDDRLDENIQAAIWDEIQNRLVPDYDGDTMSYEDWGWKRQYPKNPIVYFPQIFKAELRIEPPDSGKTP